MVKEVKGNVDTLTVRSDSSRGMWPRSHCVLPTTCTVDRRPYSSIIKYTLKEVRENGNTLAVSYNC
jgi:hypothetical protein